MDSWVEGYTFLLASNDESLFFSLRQLLEQIDPASVLIWTLLERSSIQQVVPGPYRMLFIDFQPFSLQDLLLLEMLERKSQNAHVIFLQQSNACPEAAACDESLLNLALRKGAYGLIHTASLTRGSLRVAMEQASGKPAAGGFDLSGREPDRRSVAFHP